MIELVDNTPELLELPKAVQVLGIGVVSLSTNRYSIVFNKGISSSLIKDLIHLYRLEILNKKEGKLIDLFGIYTVYIQFYTLGSEKFTLFYINEKDKLVNYGDICSLSRLFLKIYSSNVSHSKIRQVCNKVVPSVKGISALFIINSTGHTLFTKFRSDKKRLSDNYIQIGGFLSAILMFSNEVMGKSAGKSLQAITFENQQFLISIQEGIIFAYIVEDSIRSETRERYIELLKDEFIELFYDCLTDFNGDLNQFQSFGPVVEQYFSI
ncbi:MAG: hypothetical protein ACXABG_12420 [Promethearchaeota archaeon]|jgi:hypothetical protein